MATERFETPRSPLEWPGVYRVKIVANCSFDNMHTSDRPSVRVDRTVTAESGEEAKAKVFSETVWSVYG